MATTWDWKAGHSDKGTIPHVKVRLDPMSTETHVETVPIRIVGEDHRQGSKKRQLYVTKNMVRTFLDQQKNVRDVKSWDKRAGFNKGILKKKCYNSFF